MEKDENKLTPHHLHNLPYLQSAQASYKEAILQQGDAKILRKVARVGLPAVAQPQSERSSVEDSIIKVILYLFRNVAMIKRPDHFEANEDDAEISRSATIDAFHYQDIFTLLLTIGSGVNDDFSTHDAELLDVVFHLVKGVDVERLFMEKEEFVSANTQELRGLIGKERSMHRGYQRTATSRHNRFGTMMWMKRDNGKMTTVMGHTAATDEQTVLHEMDKSKKWKRPRRADKRDNEDPLTEFNCQTPLSGSARKHLRQFIERFLDSSFNPLFLSTRRSIEREAPRILHYHPREYFFLVSWLLKAESARRKQQKQKEKGSSNERSNGKESYGLVASVLNQETFVLLSRKMQEAHDHKNWQDLNACIRCFTQILQTIQDMLDSSLEEDQEIAENTLSRIFYEQATHDQIINLLRTYKNQGFGYLDALTELSHVFLRTLERYSKQNVDMQVRSIRRTRKKKQAQNDNHTLNEARNQELEAGDVQEAQRVSSERKFDFMRFSARFINQGSVETFVSFLKYYKELGTEQLKRAHRFFYRIAFKMELSTYLMRVDIIQLLQRLIKGPQGMNQEDPMFKEWEELVKQLFRLLIKKMQDRPALTVELLFSKIPNTVYYLEHGHEMEMHKKAPRVPADLEVKPGLEKEEQLRVAISALINQSKSDLLAWVKSVLSNAATERKAWEDSQYANATNFSSANRHEADGRVESLFGSQERPPEQAEVSDPIDAQDILQPSDTENIAQAPSILVRPGNLEHRQAMQRDKYLRLLLTLLSFDKLDITESDIERDAVLTSWTIPPSLTSADLQASHDLIAQTEFSPPTYDDGKTAEDFLRRKSIPSQVRTGHRPGDSDNSGSDSEGGSIQSDDENLFPEGGPTARRPDHSPKRKRRHRNKHKKDDLIDDSVLNERAAAKRKAERERAAKIKSQLFVSASDDEDDEERDRAFFEREAEMRKRQEHDVQRQSLRLRGLQGKDAENEDVIDMHEAAETSLGELTEKVIRSARKRTASNTITDEDLDFSEDPDILPRKKQRRSEETGPPSHRSSRGSSSTIQDDTFDGTSTQAGSETAPSSERPTSRDEGRGKLEYYPRLASKHSLDASDSSIQADESDKENISGSQVVAIGKGISATRPSRRGPFLVDSDSDE